MKWKMNESLLQKNWEKWKNGVNEKIVELLIENLLDIHYELELDFKYSDWYINVAIGLKLSSFFVDPSHLLLGIHFFSVLADAYFKKLRRLFECTSCFWKRQWTLHLFLNCSECKPGSSSDHYWRNPQRITPDCQGPRTFDLKYKIIREVRTCCGEKN